MTITCNLYLNGQWHDAESRRTFTRRHPAHDDVASVAAAASLADAKRCVEAAASAFPRWRDTPPAERRRLLLDAAEHMLLREAKFIAAMAAETGATAHWAGFNVHLAADILREAAALTTQIEGQIIPSNVPGNLAMGVRQGAGVVLGMAPWNAPLILATRALATPLACGNTVILKGAELSPATQGLIIGRLLTQRASRRAWSTTLPARLRMPRRWWSRSLPIRRYGGLTLPAPRRWGGLSPAPAGNISSQRYWNSAVRRAAGAGRCRYRASRGWGHFWRLRQRRADLYVHRTHYC